MVGVTLEALVIVTAIICNVHQVLGAPKFKVLDCSTVKGVKNPKEYDKCIEVDYVKPTKEDDVLLLKKVKNEATVFEGRLLKEKSKVAVTIQNASDMDEIEVVMHSKHAKGNALYKANLKKRTSSAIVFPTSDQKGVNYLDTALKIPAAFDSNAGSRAKVIAGLTSKIAVPAAGFRLPVHVFYDDSFNTRFGAGATTRINALFTIVKTIYADPSLTTVLEPDVIEITYKAGQTWTATGTHLNAVSSGIANPATSNANAYVFLCSENDQGGVVGIAWLSGTCDSSRFGRSSINEYLGNDAVTGAVIAHEIGHNLGMSHDFGSGGTSDKRYDSKGQICTGVGGYMDYQANPNKWSTCSVEDYSTYYSSVVPWCLTPLTATTTAAPTTAAPTTAAPTTAAPTTVAPTTAAPTTAAPTTVAPTVTTTTTIITTVTTTTTVAPTTAPPPTPVNDCFRLDVVAYGRNLKPAPFKKDVESSYDCQKLCQNEASCKYFVYDSKKSCYLKTGRGRLRRYRGYISGPKNCAGCDVAKSDRVTFCKLLGDFMRVGCQWNRWVRRFCANTCKICRRKRRPSGGRCRDRIGSRRCRRYRRSCRNRRVQRLCAKTCGKCRRGKTEGACKDNLGRRRCSRLRRRCRRNRYVQKNCAKTCSRC